MSFIDPAKVPFFTTVSGGKIPAIGIGTFGSDHASADEVAAAVKIAVKSGYRHIDCAEVYGNEAEIGNVLNELYQEKVVRREDLWLTGKVWNNHHGDGDILIACANTLKNLRTDYLDLMLIHWPFPNFHPPKCSVESRSPDARPYIHEEFMRAYRQLERLKLAGLVRHIGISNVTVPKLKLILRDALIKPEVNEMELHPHFQQEELYQFSRDNGMVIIGYCPLGSPNRPERDKTADDTVDMTDPVIVEIARKYNVHPAAICIRWAIQRGNVVIPMSTKERNIQSNLAAAAELKLSDAEMTAIAGIDRNCRLVKGHVFLWEGAKDYHSLWDEDGVICKN